MEKLIHLEDGDKDPLYTLRYHLLTGEKIPDNVLPATMNLLTQILGSPPASLWPKNNNVGPVTINGDTDLYEATAWMVNGSDFPVVGAFFTKEQFLKYCQDLPQGKMTWAPEFTVLHHTSSPNLAQRPNGFEKQHMTNLRGYYRNTNGWSSGPSLFTDDKGIWVFSPLTRKPTHTPSWNSIAFAIETLGNYSGVDDPESGRGAKCWDNTCWAAAVLRHVFKLKTAEKFHGEDPRTTHRECPGTKTNKAKTLAKIEAYLKQLKA